MAAMNPNSESEEDWRLRGQEAFLAGVPLVHDHYHKFSEKWDHDHCVFCFVKFSDPPDEDSVAVGWRTENKYHWICENCFCDFNTRFKWTADKDQER